MKYEDDNFFVGATKNISKISQMTVKTTGDWVKSKKIICVDSIEETPENMTYQKFKNYTVVKYMSRYGVDNVRGGSWTKCSLRLDEFSLLQSVIERINFDYPIEEIKRIYESRLEINRNVSYRKNKNYVQFLISGNYSEDGDYNDCNNDDAKMINCPLCREEIQFLRNPKLYKSIENDCVICMDKKCQVICEKCCVPFSCSDCYLKL